jgi:hypothetical protein
MASINTSVCFKTFCQSSFQRLDQTVCFVSTRQDLGVSYKHVLRRIVFELVPILSWKKAEKETIVISKLFHTEVFIYKSLSLLLEIIAWRHTIATVFAMCCSCSWTQRTDFLVKDWRLYTKIQIQGILRIDLIPLSTVSAVGITNWRVRLSTFSVVPQTKIQRV